MSETIRKPNALDFSGLFFLTIIWASAFIAIKVAVPQTGAVWLATTRVCIGFLVLLPWTLYRGIILPKTARNWAFLVVVSLLNVTIPFLLISWAELTISAGITALLLGTGPLLALLLSHATTDDDKINRNKLIGITFGFTGIILVVGNDALSDFDTGTILAQMAVLGASACYATSGAMIRKVTDTPPTRLATLILGLCSLQLLALGAYYGLPDPTTLTQDTWISLIYLGLLPTGVATILRYRLIRTIGASFFALGMNLIPVFGVILGAILLAEQVSTATWIALCLTVAGLFIARRPMPSKQMN